MLQTLQTLSVDDCGTELAYLDSGVPPHASPFGSQYTTIFAIHGMAFTSNVFEKIASTANPAGVRWVSIQRRDFPGSTPLSAADLNVLKSGTDEEKARYVRDRGVEIATFVDTFVRKNGLPPPDEKGSGGGFAILGWSLGGAFALAAAENVGALADAARARFARYMRSIILLGGFRHNHADYQITYSESLAEPGHAAIGIPPPPKLWSPFRDENIPPAQRASTFNSWVTAYFDHGDISKRDLDALEYVTPSPTRMPSITNMSAEQQAAIVYNGCALTSEFPLAGNCAQQVYATYQKAVFDQKTRESLLNTAIWVLCGDSGPSFSLSTLWVMEEDDKAHGGGKIQFRLLKGANHCMFWDYPEVTLRAILDTMA
ncbi:uncharacterized protein PHACADRAFT_165254 [Phanerochaete carnosa HHB-10118-sp]|uniref:AB hydrolase-1 domain-containing protein n=1 Tax=Phanerochaete carnosa (strain HHB-10118-sp) TaxID=650164 RepID=K5UQ25_PHACS|nr:uncharacterized protein PHACADRAFT_165254 [Phanerochaete carnosa HHB-10118-sp]EKM51921.1 hypothetical protein PHACADRAFT_165254 [Phanerochaete carnosa HHB-10118-sp]